MPLPCHQGVDIRFDEGACVELLVAQALIELFALLFDLLARGVVRANRLIADDAVLGVAQRGDRDDRWEARPVLADVGQFINVLDPREALNTRASKPGVIGVPSSAVGALARATTSRGSEISAGGILFMTSVPAWPSIRSAPTLKIWITPFASVAMLEKLALLKMARCKAPAFNRASSACLRAPPRLYAAGR